MNAAGGRVRPLLLAALCATALSTSALSESALSKSATTLPVVAAEPNIARSNDDVQAEPAPMTSSTGTGTLTADRSTANALSEGLAALSVELAEARSRHTALEDSNARLTELNAQLRQEIESLAIELQTARDLGEHRSLLYGAGLILAGLVVGALLRRRPRTGVWN